jgi:hypothetical protein
MPNYIFRLDGFDILETRSGTFLPFVEASDTDHVTLSVKVGDRDYGPVIRHVGDVKKGHHTVNLEVGPVAVDAANAPVFVNLQILNIGHNRDDHRIQDALNKGADALAAKALASGGPWFVAAAGVIEILKATGVFDKLAHVLDPNCDGPVAIDQFRYTGASLENLVADGGSMTRQYPGTPSDDGCGANSDYSVTWSVRRA